MNASESQHLSPNIADALERAYKSHSEGSTNLAIEQLEAELEKPAHTSDLMQFKGRVSLAVAIAEFCVAMGDREKALRTLATEAVSAKATFQNIKAVGTEGEKRMAFRGLVQQIRNVADSIAPLKTVSILHSDFGSLSIEVALSKRGLDRFRKTFPMTRLLCENRGSI